MSTIKVENIRIASESVSRPVTGVAAAWCFFQGTGTVAINNSLNVSSMTDNSVGNYNENFSSNMDSANYSIQIVSGRVATVTGDNQCAVFDNQQVPTASTFAVRTAGENFSGQDVARIYTTNHGDLA